MKKILVILLLLLGLTSVVWASPNDIVGLSGQSSMSVVVFMDQYYTRDSKLTTELGDIVRDKFRQAKSIAIYGDNQAKSPQFLEFIEKVQTNPLNEKDIKVISLRDLADYGRATNSKYVAMIRVFPYNLIEGGYFFSSSKVAVSVIDVDTQRYVEYRSWNTEEFAKNTMKKMAAEFDWSPSTNAPIEKTENQYEEKRRSVVVFLPDQILDFPDLVVKVRKTVMDKFRVSDVPIYIDNKPKSPEFLDFISGVGTDCAKQQAFILKKERLVEYGKNTNSNSVIAIVVSVISKGNTFTGYSFRLKEDIFVVDVEANQYLSNAVYDTETNKSARSGIEFLMDKLQNEFRLP